MEFLTRYREYLTTILVFKIIGKVMKNFFGRQKQKNRPAIVVEINADLATD